MNYIKAFAFLIITIAVLYGGRIYTAKIDQQQIENQAKQEEAEKKERAERIASLNIKDVVSGKGEEAHLGDVLKVHYVGTLPDGKKFDSSYDRSEPLEFQLGTPNLIPGWNLGLEGMKVGGKRTFLVPPDLGYGNEDRGIIPAGSTLNFTVELLGVEGPNSAVKE